MRIAHWVDTKWITTDSGERLCLAYSVLKTERPDQTAPERYGVKIDVFRGEERIDGAEIEDISTNLLEIERLVVLLSNYTVTPTTIYEVIDDYLGTAN